MNDFAKIILPTIRKIIPNMIATDLVGVQPMASLDSSCHPGTRILDGQEYKIVSIGLLCSLYEITTWCDANGDDNMWFLIGRDIYFMDDPAYTMFVLRWV